MEKGSLHLIKIKTMWQSYACVWLHFIWSTKNREPLISNNIKYILYDKIREIAKAEDIHLDFINGIEDHVHTLVSLNTIFRICDVAKMLKGGSSIFVNNNSLIEQYFDWQDGYAVFSVSPTNLPRVRNYIKNQELHHKRFTLDEELLRLRSIAME